MIRDNVYIYGLQAAMQRKFLSNVLITLTANLLVKPLWILGVDRTFQNRLGLETYGQYTNLFTFSVVLGLLLDFGINNYNASSLARNSGLLNKQFYPLALLKGILSGLYLSLTLLLGWLYGYDSEALYILFVLSINQCLAYGFTYLRSTLSGLQLYKTDAIISTTDRLTMVVGGAALLLFNLFPISIQLFVYLQTMGYGVAVLIGWISLRKHLRSVSFGFDIEQIKSMFVKSAPYAILALLMMVYTRSDVLLIPKLFPTGDTENGIYAQSTRLLEAVNMLAVLVSGLLLPMFSNLLQSKDQLTPLVRLAMVFLWVPAIVGVVGCIYYADVLLPLLYHQFNGYHTRVFGWSFASVLPMCVMYVFGTLLTAAGEMRLLIRLAAIALVINLSLNLFLIPSYGAEGAAIALLITHSFIAISNTYFAIKRLALAISGSYFIGFLVLAIICWSVLALMEYWQVPMVVALSLFPCFALVGVWRLRLVDSEQLTKAIQQFRRQ